VQETRLAQMVEDLTKGRERWMEETSKYQVSDSMKKKKKQKNMKYNN
jgi:hypothetical protein